MGTSVFQSSFAAGELSPRLRGRADAEVYAHGLALCENFEPLPTGPIRTRGGTRKVDELALGGTRLIPFKASSGLEFLLELGDLSLRVYTVSGTEDPGASNPELVTNGTFDAGSTGWTLTPGGSSNPTVSGGRLKLPIGRVFDPDARTYEDDESGASTTITVVDPATYRFRYSKPGGTASVQVHLTGPGGASFYMYGTTATFALGPGTYTIAFTPGGSYGEYAYIDDVSMKKEANPAGLTITAPWTDEQLPAVQFVVETGQDRIIFVHPNVAPWYLARSALGVWSYGSITFTSKPTEWTGTDWPSVCEIHAGRLWLASIPSALNRVWASKVGSLFDFGLGTGTATDAIDVKVSTKGAIRWIQAQRNLLMGSDQGEHYVTASSGVITPSDIQITLGSAFGSAALQALVVGDQVLYISSDRRKPRVIGFEFQTDGWVSHDLAFTAGHMTDALVNEVHFAKTPYPALVFVTGDGELRICSYDRASQVLGWWRFSTPGGTINSAAVTDGAAGSIVWLSVTRAAGTYLETLRLDDVTGYPLDAQITATVASGVVSGLDHLEGLEVRIVVGGAVSTATVDSGQVAVDAEDGVEAAVGLAFTARATTLPRNAKGGKVQNAKIGVLLNDSGLPLLNGKRASERSPATNLDDPTARITGKAEVYARGWDGEGKIEIEQDLPIRTEILALYSTTQANEV